MNGTVSQAWALNLQESRKEKRAYKMACNHLKEQQQKEFTKLEIQIHNDSLFLQSSDPILMDKKDKLEMLRVNFISNFGEEPQSI